MDRLSLSPALTKKLTSSRSVDDFVSASRMCFTLREEEESIANSPSERLMGNSDSLMSSLEVENSHLNNDIDDCESNSKVDWKKDFNENINDCQWSKSVDGSKCIDTIKLTNMQIVMEKPTDKHTDKQESTKEAKQTNIKSFSQNNGYTNLKKDDSAVNSINTSKLMTNTRVPEVRVQILITLFKQLTVN